MKLSDFFSHINIKIIKNYFLIVNEKREKPDPEPDYYPDIENTGYNILEENISGYISDDHDFDTKDVLVGSLKNTSQLGIILKHNFYHLPADIFDKSLFPVNYVAIYQSKRFFGKNAGIVYYGKVSNSYPVKRCDIKEIPDKSTKTYYRFEIAGWEKLPRPIIAKDKGLIVKMTNLFLLKNAREVPELWLDNYDEFIFYNQLKTLTESGAPFEHRNYRFYIDNDNITAAVGNNVICKYKKDNMIRLPEETFSNIKSDLGI